jgi:Lantibiotic dehydratase, N terminus
VAGRGYKIGPLFLIRTTGVPFEAVLCLSTGKTMHLASRFVEAEAKFQYCRRAVEQLLLSRQHDLSRDEYRGWRKVIRHDLPQSSSFPDTQANPFEAYRQAAEVYLGMALALEQTLLNELKRARQLLSATANGSLPHYLVFAAEHARLLLCFKADVAIRNKSVRASERHLLLYLQRVCTKNDTFSEFGPASWGRIEPNAQSLELHPQPVARREVFLERWTAHGVAAAINADPEALPEIAPRLNPDGRVEDDHFAFTETGERYRLDAETETILRSIDGKRPAFSLGIGFEKIRALAEKKIIRWELEVPALEAHAFDRVLDDVSRWRDNAVRARWMAQLQPIARLAREFATTREVPDRLLLIEETEERLQHLGAHKTASRFLYAATNPIGEECVRESHFVINESLINEVVTEAAPWIDLWRDNYAFVAGRVAAGLRRILEEAPRQNGSVPLPAFLKCCRDAQLPLEGAGMVALAHLAFREVKEAFAERLHDRAYLPQVQLTEEDCHFVRQSFAYAKFDECTYPSADLQLAASSAEAVGRGEYQWIVAELHPPVALLHHGFYWSCPDKTALARAIEGTLLGKPYLYYGYFAADFTATTTVRLDALPEATKFVASQRSVGHWQTFHPADTEVFVDEVGDVGVRVRETHEYLGSFARGWVIPLGFHPFFFSLGRHSPRLLCGKVVVQRESWTVTLEELGPGDFTGVSRDLVIAVEKLRAARNLPRHVFIRPTEQALGRSGVEGRDKDTKPVYIDFESYLFLEVFHRWITKAGEIEITEMLPRPDQLLWCEADGHHTFELRTQLVPR